MCLRPSGMEMIPARPWQSERPSVSTPINKQSTKQGNARGTSEVRRGTSSNHFHCPVPRSSSHFGHGVLHRIGGTTGKGVGKRLRRRNWPDQLPMRYFLDMNTMCNEIITYPDPPILAFFLVLRFSLLFCAFSFLFQGF